MKLIELQSRIRDTTDLCAFHTGNFDIPIVRIFMSIKDFEELLMEPNFHMASMTYPYRDAELEKNNADFQYMGIYGNLVHKNIEPQFVIDLSKIF